MDFISGTIDVIGELQDEVYYYESLYFLSDSEGEDEDKYSYLVSSVWYKYAFR